MSDCDPSNTPFLKELIKGNTNLYEVGLTMKVSS
jgi:hypothetical protein